jgi:hypothetical protein
VPGQQRQLLPPCQRDLCQHPGQSHVRLLSQRLHWGRLHLHRSAVAAAANVPGRCGFLTHALVPPDINECLVGNGGCSTTCFNAPGNFSCAACPRSEPLLHHPANICEFALIFAAVCDFSAVSLAMVSPAPTSTNANRHPAFATHSSRAKTPTAPSFARLVRLVTTAQATRTASVLQ